VITSTANDLHTLTQFSDTKTLMNQASTMQPEKAGNIPKQNVIPRSLALQNNTKLKANPKQVYKKSTIPAA